MPDDIYSNIRQILGPCIGKRVVEITQHDEAEWKENHDSYVMLMFEDGSTLKFPVQDKGFVFNDGVPE
jgi:hypothetical protein